MSKTITTDVEQAIEFLRFLFGDQPQGFIATLKSKPGEVRPSSDNDEEEEKPQKPKSTELCHAYTAPERIDSDWWRQYSPKYNIWFCTATIKDKNRRHGCANSLDIPALWFDLDACKYIGVPGKAFYSDIKSLEDVSAWVESSENALQGYYKLKDAYPLNGDKESFKKDLRELLLDIAMYFGGDLKVVSPARLMRLPGSLNVKPEYPKPYQVIAHTCDNTYSLKELKKKFSKVDENTVPRVVSFAISYILQSSELWNEGSRHDISYPLAGTVRKCGMNKQACLNLFDALSNVMGDDEVREADVESTYDQTDLTAIASLRSTYGEIAEEVERVIKFWLELKIEYCKKKRIKFTPDNYDPTKPAKDNGLFFVRNNETYYHGDDHDDLFGNFCIHLRGKLVKATTQDIVWLANVIIKGQPVKTVEISAASHNTWATFSKIPHIPTGLSMHNAKLWSHYIAWLAENCPEDTFTETPYYGWLDTETEDEISLLLPNQPHERYIWTRNNEDTATPGGMEKELETTKIKEYLSTFGDYISTYHESRYVWPTLGWFASAPLSAFFRQEIGGFPALVVYGLAGSGKSQLIKKVLGPHFGCKTVSSYDGITPHFIRMHLTSNNICPMIVDEFRDLGGGKHDQTQKASDFLGIIRSSWDGLETGAGKGDGTLRKDKFQAPLCVVGEHLYGEDATLHRTFSIVLNHDWLHQFNNVLSADERAERLSRMRWLEKPNHNGWLGTIILNWIQNNREEALNIMEQCLIKIDKECPRDVVERKRNGFASPLAGLYILKRIYQSYGLEFPIRAKTFMDLIFEADPQSKQTNYGTTALTELFKATDTAISINLRRKTPLLGSVYVIDPLNPKVAYFDINRWRSEVRQFFSGTASAALTNDAAFLNLLRDCTRKKETSPVQGFPDNHPVFQQMCVKIDLAIVAKLFGINTHQWGDYETQFSD